jgi:predicted secreted protein
MKIRYLIAASLLVAALAPGFAGDVATFVNLGFSEDSSYFMFGQYGVDQSAGAPYAELFLVDNAKNDFVPKGVTRKTYAAKLEAGQDCSGAIFSLFAEQASLAKKYKIDHLRPGRLLYVLVDGEEPPAILSFRDFKTGASYEVSLNQSSSQTKAGAATSSFGIAVTATGKDGSSKRITGGNPDIKREGVKSYVVRRIIAAPDEKTLLFIVEKRTVAKGDPGVRYMVEALKLP